MEEQLLFEEKQYMGFNKWSILWRTVLALFCFILYYWSENPKPIAVSGIELPASPVDEHSGHLFFLMGIVIMVLSLVLVFVLHIKTTVNSNSLTLDGLWTSRKVKIGIANIAEVNKVKYSEYILNPPVYNLHFKNKIRFYTSGNNAVELTDKDGQVYLIGTQKADQLTELLKKITVEKTL